MDIDSLTESGYARLTYHPRVRRYTTEAMESWRQFCNLPEEDKNLFSGGDRVIDFGYMRRRDPDQLADDKELFHASLADMSRLREIAQQLNIRSAASLLFINSVESIIRAISPMVLEFATALERRYSLAGFREDVEISMENWVFRYLHYFPGETFAHPHADRGGFTLHLNESSGGGEYLGFDHVWRPWPVADKETIIFPGLGLQHRSDNKLKALYHRVVSSENTRRAGRFSMVAFIDFRHDHRYDETRLGAVRHQPPGFNYAMSAAAFQNLFVARV